MPWSSSYRGGSSRVSCFECGGPHYVKNCPDWRARKQRKKAEGPGATWTQYKVADLKRLCQERGLKVSGRKAELVKRLQEHFDGEQASRRQGQAGCGAAQARAAASSSSAAHGAAAPPSSAAKSDVSALFDLSDDEANDAAVANTVPTTKPAATVVASTPRAAISSSLSQSSTTGHGTLPSFKASRVSTASKAPIASGAVTPAAVGTFNAITPMPLSQSSTASNAGLSLSQLSQSSSSVSSSSGSKPQITDEQKERIRRSREEAQRRKKARLSAPSTGSSGKVGQVTVNPYDKKAPMNPYGKKPASNPYEKKAPTKRDEGVPEEDVMMGEIGGKLSKLPPLPPDAPPVRKDTLEKLSEEQLEVIMMARPPDAYSEDVVEKRKTSVVDRVVSGDYGGDEDDHGPVMVRVNAAAGTGKTTTLMHLATRLIDLGHESLTYVTFSRAAAKDAQDRMQSQLDDEHKHRVSASTLHSCALRLLGEAANDSEEGDNVMLGDMALKKLIGEKWGKALREYIDPAMRHLKASMAREGEEDADEANISYKLDGKKKQLFDKALLYLFKTFETFTRNDLSLEDLRDRSKGGRHYYPVCKKNSVFHKEGDAAELGFPPAIYTLKSSYSFFADTTVEIWDFVIENGIRTFNIMIKKAQLGGLRVPGSAILVDESQDLDKSQVSWIKNQKKHGTHIFWVGDSAQCIFGFRGAKAKNVMGLDCVDTKLTKSWRFGPEIAKVANIALFAKEKSIQTTINTGNSRVWIPYRMKGARRTEGEEGGGVVTTESLLANWKEHRPLTLIGNTNAGLMIQALDLLGLGALKSNDAEDAGEDSSGDGVDDETEGGARAAIDVASIPKFHIIGKGESSGMKKWRDAMWQVRHLYELYTNKDEAGHIPMSLPASQFREFADEGPLTWGTFIELCKIKEITKFNVALGIIATYQQNTLTAMDSFEAHVTGSIPAEEADIILTTCHQAKGLEWDRVEIADDFYDLAAASFNHSDPSRVRHPSFLASTPSSETESSTLGSLEASEGENRKGWQFVLGEEAYHDQHINKLYVALTRARKTLSVPKSIKMLLKDMDVLHYLVESYKKDALDGNGSKRPAPADESTMVIGKSCKRLSKGDVWNLYHDLCVPLRQEMGTGDSMILPTLFPGCEEDESMETEIEREQEGAQAELSSNRESIADLFDC